MASLNVEQLKSTGDVPPARFGHTLTLCGKNKAVLFGGAIGDSGKFIITNELYMIDLSINQWTKLNQQGNIPSQRAAHAACMIETNQIVVYGGAASGGGGLSSDDLFLLDMRSNQYNPSWVSIPTHGQTPGKRYGHTMVFFKPFLIVFGGNTGIQPVNDVWILNVEKAPYQWQQFNPTGPQPSVRVYHSAALCQTGSANGMMVIFGGRTSDQSALNDSWGLRRHRDGKWDWVLAPYRSTSEADMPICRYQHWITFSGSLMLVIGGRTNATDEQQQSMEIYDTESSDWYKVQSVNRYRHSVLLIENKMLMYGGFEPEFPNKPLDSMLQIDISKIGTIFPKLSKNFFGTQNNSNILQERNNNNNNIQAQQTMNQKENYKPQYNQIANQTFNNGNQKNNQNVQHEQHQQEQQLRNGQVKKVDNGRSTTPMKGQQKLIRISNQAIVAQTYEPDQEYNNQLIRKVLVQNLAEESKKLLVGIQQDFQGLSVNDNLCQLFIQSLLRPGEWKPIELKLPFRRELIVRLCDEVVSILESQATLLKVRAPIKIIGSIHGRFNELLRFFENFGAPSDDLENLDGDIEKFDYLFLGNYVDKGFNSLEVICLLFALKLKYPEQIHLLRGSHEDRKINRLYGLAEECSIRLNEDINDINSVYQRVNRVFDMMPLGAILEDKILCLPGGLGKNIQSLEEIENIQRPIQNLWDSYNIYANELINSTYIEQQVVTIGNPVKDIFKTNSTVKFGDLKVNQFLNENKINMIIRSGTPLQEGFETNQAGTVISLFSCPDYMGQFQNMGSLIKVTKNFQIIPHQLQPTVLKQGTWLKPETQLKTIIKYSQDEMALKQRQPTPPKKPIY